MHTKSILLPTAYGKNDIETRTNFSENQPRIKFLLNNIDGCKKLLDIGCFLGYYSSIFAGLASQVIGIDVCPDVIQKAKELHPDIEFHCVDAMQIAQFFEHGSFNCVVASEVIEHTLDPIIFLDNVRQVLACHGKLILTTQNSNGIQFRLRMLFGRFRWDFTHYRLYSKAEIVSQVKDAGFEIEKVRIVPIAKYGPQKLLRWFAYYLALMHPNFGWTTCIVARKR